ncbi:hypothetical protein [Nocardia brasiliensis]|uniref:hypothetical protein n=1 Tax=Nocardia brasiliensis TaxID=37326 RepID=UPI0036715B79
MATGDDPDEVSGGSQGSEAPDAPPNVTRGTDPSVESVWLRHRPPPHRGLPRLSTVLLTVTFIALLILWVVLRPGG